MSENTIPVPEVTQQPEQAAQSVEMPEQIPADTVEAVPAEAVEEVPAEAPAEVAEEVPAEAPAEVAEEAPAEAPAEAAKEAPAEITAEAAPEEKPEAAAPAEQAPANIAAQAPAEEAGEIAVPAEKASAAPAEEVSAAPAEQKESAPVDKKAQKPWRPLRKRVHWTIRVLMQIISILLCLTLAMSILGTVLISDIHSLTSSNVIESLVSGLMGETDPAPTDPVKPAKTIPQRKLSRGADSSDTDNSTDSGNLGDIIPPDFELPEDFEIPELPANLMDPAALIQWVVEIAQELLGPDAAISPESIEKFLMESSVPDYLTEKVGGYVEDVLEGEMDTEITTDEVIELVEENKELIQKHFGVEINDDQMDKITEAVDKVIVEEQINEKIQSAVTDIVENDTPVIGGLTVRNILDYVRMGFGFVQKVLQTIGVVQDEIDILETLRVIVQLATSGLVVLACAGGCLLLVLLLCLANFYNVPKGLTWASVPFLVIGLFLSVPMALVQITPALLQGILPALDQTLPVIAAFLGSMAPAHYTVLAVGVVLFVIATVWRLIRRSKEKKMKARQAVPA